MEHHENGEKLLLSTKKQCCSKPCNEEEKSCHYEQNHDNDPSLHADDSCTVEKVFENKNCCSKSSSVEEANHDGDRIVEKHLHDDGPHDCCSTMSAKKEGENVLVQKSCCSKMHDEKSCHGGGIASAKHEHDKSHGCCSVEQVSVKKDCCSKLHEEEPCHNDINASEEHEHDTSNGSCCVEEVSIKKSCCSKRHEEDSCHDGEVASAKHEHHESHGCCSTEKASAKKSCCSEKQKVDPCHDSESTSEKHEHDTSNLYCSVEEDVSSKKGCCSGKQKEGSCHDGEIATEKHEHDESHGCCGVDEITAKKSCCSEKYEEEPYLNGEIATEKYEHDTSNGCCSVEEDITVTKRKSCCSKKQKEEACHDGEIANGKIDIEKHEKNYISNGCCTVEEAPAKKSCCSELRKDEPCHDGVSSSTEKQEHDELHECCSVKEVSIKKSCCTKLHKEEPYSSVDENEKVSKKSCCSKGNEGDKDRVKAEEHVGSHSCCANEKSPLLNNQHDNGIINSSILVQEICCASEIPLIKDVLNPLLGLSEIKVNTTTKIVHVKHDQHQLSAMEIVDALNDAKFGAKLKIDGAVSIKKNITSYSETVQSKIFVKEICCASEIPLINDIVLPISGVSNVKVNTTTKMVYVDHTSTTITALDIVSALNEAKFGARLELDGGALPTLTSVSRGASSLVESTFLVSSAFDNTMITHLTKSMKLQFSPEHIAHVETHILSKTLKVDHNPFLVNAEAIRTFMDEQGFETSIICDGYEERVWTIDENIGGSGDEDLKPKLKLNIVFSGIFWVVSMLSLIGGKWAHLEYAGVLSVVLGIPKVASKAIATMRRFTLDTNGMMLLATIGALLLHDYSEAASVAFLFSISEYLEQISTFRARTALSSIAKLRPERARVKDKATNKFLVVPATSVPIGSIVSVPTGDKVPCDGVVIEGTSTMDESSLTGESRPIRKSVGEKVSGGTINSGRAQLLIQTSSVADDSAVSRLIKLVEEAQTNRSPTELLVDKFAKRYTPAVVMLSLSLCTFPWLISAEVGRAFTNMGLITIVVACPCALIISTPVTYVAAIASAAQNGIVVKGGAHLEVR